MKTAIIIPARLQSTRLPRKMLLAETGRPLILHTVEAARRCRLADRVLVATDDREILEAVERFGAEAVMTDPQHTSGTDRIAEAAASVPDCDLIVNLQGDEPEMNPEAVDKAIDLLKPGMSSDKIAAALPKAQDAGFNSEMDAFGLNFCHGLGLGLHERPLISRLNSFKDPIELKVGMVFAVETYCPASDGVSAARIEEEVILTPTGAKIISLFPAEELPVANPYMGSMGKSR